MDDYLQHEDCYDPSPRGMRRTLSYVEEEAHYQTLLADISTQFLSVENGKMAADAEPPPPLKQDGGVDNANRLVWESASMLSNSRPPSSFVVYNKDGDVDMSTDDATPIFDGSVANATPPPWEHLVGEVPLEDTVLFCILHVPLIRHLHYRCF